MNIFKEDNIWDPLQDKDQILKEVLHAIIDMESDGHCGFRAISRIIYGTQHNHFQVRRKMLETLDVYKNDYRELGFDVEILRICLNWFENHAPSQYWLSNGEISQIVCDTFQRPLIFLSMDAFLRVTFFPLQNGFPNLYTLSASRNHFRLVLLPNLNGIKFTKVDPLYLYHHQRYPCGSTYLEAYKENLQEIIRIRATDVIDLE